MYAEVISVFSPGLQEAMLAEIAQLRRNPTRDKKVMLMPGLAEKKADDKAAEERLEEAMRFEVHN
jgi:hypothetical protein